MSDGIFPTFGVIAPVPDYLKAIEPYAGYLCLDDSHAVGHLGRTDGAPTTTTASRATVASTPGR